MRSGLRHGVGLGALLLASLPAAAFQADAGTHSATPFALGLPDKPWQLLVELPGFNMVPVEQPPGGARAQGTVERSGLMVSLTLGRSPDDPSARSCRDRDWSVRQKTELGREETTLSEAGGGRARVEFLLPSPPGESGQEKHVLLYLQRDGVCAVIHLSKLHYTPKDAEDLERLLASVRLGS